jgi:hypothetical protein
METAGRTIASLIEIRIWAVVKVHWLIRMPVSRSEEVGLLVTCLRFHGSGWERVTMRA